MKIKESKGLLALFSDEDDGRKPLWSSECDDNIISFFSVVKDFIDYREFKKLKDFKNDGRELINEPEEENS